MVKFFNAIENLFRGEAMDRYIKEIVGKLWKEENKILIGISGPGAAGKTTFAKKLIDSLDTEVNYLNTDPYIITDVRKYAEISYTYEKKNHMYKMTACHPVAHNLLVLTRDIEMLKEGFTFKTIGTDYAKSMILSADNKINIVEGMSVAFLDLELFDFTIYLHVDGDVELARRMNRDVKDRGRSIEHLKNSHIERRIQYELFMHPMSEKFDLVIENS